MKAVIYCRVSTEEQVKNLSLSTQKKVCSDYCNRQGFEVDNVFIEEGESAKTTNRTQFQQMLGYCKKNKGRIKYVVVYNLQRFSRNVEDHHTIRGILLGLGIYLRSATEQIDETPAGRLMETIISGMAQYDNDQRKERTITGMKAALELGQWTHLAPLGYLNTEDERGRPSLIFDPERAPFVRRIFELYSTGLYTKRQVLRIITDKGLRTRKGKKLSPQSLDQMLHNPIYTGWLIVPKLGERHRGKFEPLVSQETFDKVQDQMKGKRPTVTPHIRNRPDFPLRSFVKCGHCNRPLTASWSKGRDKRYPYYHCTNRNCNGLSVRKETLEKVFIDHLTALQPRLEYLKLFSEIVLDVWRNKRADAMRHLATINRQLENLRQRKDKLDEVFIFKGAIDQATYERQRDKLNEEIADAETAVHEAKLEELDLEAVLNFAQHVLLNAARLWIKFSLDQKQRLQKVIFPEGLVYTPEGFRITVTSPIFSLLQMEKTQKTILAPQVGLEPTTLRLTAGCSAIELLRSMETPSKLEA